MQLDRPPMNDQAEGLRQMAARSPVQVMAVTSGKGGVGKSTVAVNIAIALAKAGKQSMLMDADLGLANLDVLLNIQPRFNLSHVLEGEKNLEDVIVEGPSGVMIVPAASGIQRLATLQQTECMGLVNAFSDLRHGIDHLVIDTASGLSNSVTSFSRAAREVLIVVCDEPASITDAYATIKVLSRDCQVDRFHVVANKARSVAHGRELYDKLLRVTDRFLTVQLDYLGTIPYDEYLVKAVRQQKSVVDAYPRSRASMAFMKMANVLSGLPKPTSARGDLEFFVERLIRYSVTEGISVV